jgi:hypothetical protein
LGVKNGERTLSIHGTIPIYLTVDIREEFEADAANRLWFPLLEKNLVIWEALVRSPSRHSAFPANSIGDNNEQAERLVLGYRCGRDMHVGILAGVGTSICHRERTGTPWRARHQTGCPADRTVGKDRLQESKQQEQFGMP